MESRIRRSAVDLKETSVAQLVMYDETVHMRLTGTTQDRESEAQQYDALVTATPLRGLI